MADVDGRPETVRLKELTLTDDGDKVVVGDPAVGRFIAVPPVGALVIRALQRGDTVAEARSQAEALAGEPVDVEAFLAALRQIGLSLTARWWSTAPRRSI